MGRAAAESILHGLLAALAIAAILGAGCIREPRTRLRFWLLAMAFPALFTPGCQLLFPVRGTERFRDTWALFSGERFSLLTWRGLDLGAACSLALAGTGLLLYLRDLIPFAVDVMRSHARTREVAAAPEALVRSVAATARAMQTAAPRLLVLDTRHPILTCRGLRRPIIVTSSGLLDMLAPDELDAAMAHEVAHAKRRDPAFGWVLMVARGLFFWNPSLQLCARAAVHDIERLADQSAATAAGGPDPVARGLRVLTHSASAATGTRRPGAWHGFRLAAIEERRRSLAEGRNPAPLPRFALAATAIGLGVILFFTVA
jgi:Zn-dependent protease with chaperone function